MLHPQLETSAVDVGSNERADQTRAVLWRKVLDHPKAAGKTFNVLQALRALAAILVVVSHANTSFFGNARYWVDLPFGNYPEFGHAGVEFFFVLSGFIIYAAHRRDLGIRAKAKPFVWKRFRRVYPTYWLVLLLIMPLYLLIPALGSGSEREAATIFDNVLLVHVFGKEPGGEILTVAWTLFHEVLFYAIFAIAILDRRVGAVAFCAWIIASCVTLVAPALVPHVLVFWLSPLHLLFAMGMAVAWQMNRGRFPVPWAMVAAGLALFFGTGAEEALWGNHLPHDVGVVLYGLGSALVVAGGVELERAGRLRVSPILVFLGDASYSIYLINLLAMSILAKVAMVVVAHVAVPRVAIYFGLIIGATVAGALFHLVAEAPLLAFLSRVRSAPRTIEPAPT